LDPVFSTGVTLAMVGGQKAGLLATQMLRGEIAPRVAQKTYIKFITGSTAVFWKLIRNYYKHSFRELFMNGRGPMNVHGAVISTLAGQVFPRPIWALRWRLRFFELCVWAQKYWNIVPRRPPCRLVDQRPTEWVPEQAPSTA
ncbi:MAG: hypothetical protein H7144_07250, partial [Burkholderiales bacterium]|nr:hypothetical protein [Phycisphaerae bacterium]